MSRWSYHKAASPFHGTGETLERCWCLPLALMVHVDEATAVGAKHHGLVLEVAFSSLVTDGAVEGVIHQQELHHALPTTTPWFTANATICVHLTCIDLTIVITLIYDRTNSQTLSKNKQRYHMKYFLKNKRGYSEHTDYWIYCMLYKVKHL